MPETLFEIHPEPEKIHSEPQTLVELCAIRIVKLWTRDCIKLFPSMPEPVFDVIKNTAYAMKERFSEHRDSMHINKSKTVGLCRTKECVITCEPFVDFMNEKALITMEMLPTIECSFVVIAFTFNAKKRWGIYRNCDAKFMIDNKNKDHPNTMKERKDKLITDKWFNKQFLFDFLPEGAGSVCELDQFPAANWYRVNTIVYNEPLFPRGIKQSFEILNEIITLGDVIRYAYCLVDCQQYEYLKNKSVIVA
jgi:hypothetical protein